MKHASLAVSTIITVLALVKTALKSACTTLASWLLGFYVVLIEMFSLICRSHLPDKSKTTFNNGQKPQKEFIKDKASC